MTSTNLSVSQTLTAGYGVLPATASSVTLNAATTCYTISVKLTNGARAGDPGKPLRVYIVSSAFTSSTPKEELKKEAAVLDVQPHADPAGVTIQASPLLARKGDTVYVWYEVPNWAASGVVSSLCYEIN